MSLTYIETVQRTEKRERTLEVPKKWAMFTAQGNSRMRTKALKLVKKLEVSELYSDKVKAFEWYFKAYYNACLSKSKVMSEASDTAVRETVWCFALKAGQTVGVSEDTLDDLWNNKHK